MITISNMTIGFDGETVLENINLEIPAGEITIILGRSGCGKSVLMKTIEGLYQPWQGSVTIDGNDINIQSRRERNKTRRRLAMLFQGSALLDSFTVYQNIALPLREHTTLNDAEIHKQVLEKLGMVGLTGILNKLPSQLSGGMRKRVALARAIIMQPKYLIYDEPTTGLDPVMSDEIVDLILKLHTSYQLGSIIITHDFACINRIKGRIVMLSEKTVIFDGQYTDFVRSADPRIRQFIRQPEEK